jgi:sugar lactone lactonase YvrE
MKTNLAVSTASFSLSLLLLAAPGTSRADSLFVGNVGNSTIEEFSSSGVGRTFGSLTLGAPGGLAFDNSGNLYVASSSGSIEKFNSSGVGTLFASTSAYTEGLAFDSVGNLYAGNYFNNSVEKYNSSGTDLGVFANSANSGQFTPWGLAFDSAGNLYVANSGNNTIEEFNSSGTDLGVFASSASSGLSMPVDLAFQPVPEPSTWALLAGGLIALLPVRRRRV